MLNAVPTKGPIIEQPGNQSFSVITGRQVEFPIVVKENLDAISDAFQPRDMGGKPRAERSVDLRRQAAVKHRPSTICTD